MINELGVWVRRMLRDGREIIQVNIEGSMPPSLNHLYVRTRSGPPVVISKEARSWRAEILGALSPKAARIQLDPSKLYRLLVVFRSRKFLRKNPVRKDNFEERYLKIDSNNLLKFLEDCLESLLGVGDHHFFDVQMIKVVSKEDEPENIYIEVEEILGGTRGANRRPAPTKQDRAKTADS